MGLVVTSLAACNFVRQGKPLVVSNMEIIHKIYQARYGQPFDAADAEQMSAFLREMLDYRNVLRRVGRATVAAAAVRSWLVPRGKDARKSVPKREPAINFLHGYVLWVDHGGRIPADRKAECASLEFALRTHLNPSLPAGTFLGDAPRLSTSKRVAEAPLGATIRNMVATIVAASEKNNLRSERDDFFRGGGDEHRDDRIYYVMYRFSTNNGDVLKSFLKIKPPQDLDSKQYQFNHFVQGGRGAMDGAYEIFRECEGVIIKFATAYYFIGYNFVIPVNKRSHPNQYKLRRKKQRHSPNGMGLLASEYDGFNYNPGLLSAVTMTLAASQQPIVARAVLLHIGTKSSLGCEITDDHVQPAELPMEEVAQDIRDIVERLRGLGAKSFSEVLQAAVYRRDWDGDGHKRLAATILRSIDNTPAWEKGSGGKPKIVARGAIETVDLEGENIRSPRRPRN